MRWFLGTLSKGANNPRKVETIKTKKPIGPVRIITRIVINDIMSMHRFL